MSSQPGRSRGWYTFTMDFDQKMLLIRALDLRLAFAEASERTGRTRPGGGSAGEAGEIAGPLDPAATRWSRRSRVEGTRRRGRLR